MAFAFARGLLVGRSAYCNNLCRPMYATRSAASGKWYTKSHEYIAVENGQGTVGISNHAQEELGEIVFVNLPSVGDACEGGENSIAEVESVKSCSPIYSPVRGEVIEINAELENRPGLINESAEGEGWLFKLSIADESELENLMTEEDYSKHCEESH